MKKGIYLLPNLITMGNMFCGYYAIISTFNGHFTRAATAILVAAVMDGLDGKVARLTNSSSRFGVEFDSIADVVSFGIAPAILIYAWALKPFGRFGWAAAFLFAVCGALRLARFNVQVDDSESKDFTGLPIPGAACMIASLVIMHKHLWGIETQHPLLLMLTAYVLAFLMVSNIKYRSFKEAAFKKRKPFSILVAASLVLFLVVSAPQVTLFLVFAAYACSGIIERLFFAHRATAEKPEEKRTVFN